ncbi:MAG: hypothetical protein PHV29_00620 [Candidatus Pacebacteria bacterium]|nr:hypothetical protein [Candidatus Paceibacterota bacterium]MDD2757101.1 hypothetical protein [Candidatus Paceibacterota bacterium]MDD4737656.1 hypothetical protein [Candidatus Paceibacterota bacterium]
MRKRDKILIFCLTGLLIISSVWFYLFFLEDNIMSFEEKLITASQDSDVVVIFNSGGWGTIPFENAMDFNPIINEVKELIEDQGLKVSIVEYHRTKESIIGKLGSLREILQGFPSSSSSFARAIDDFLENNPGDKVIIAGLSNGAAFANSAIEKIEKNKESVFSIELGAPFWKKKTEGINMLGINNQNDILVNGQIGGLLFSLFRAPFIWTYENIKGNKTSFSEAMNISGHDYYWEEHKEEITLFIKERI